MIAIFTSSPVNSLTQKVSRARLPADFLRDKRPFPVPIGEASEEVKSARRRDREEMRRLGHDLRGQLTEGARVVENVDAPAVRRDDEIGRARMNLKIVHANVGQAADVATNGRR